MPISTPASMKALASGWGVAMWEAQRGPRAPWYSLAPNSFDSIRLK
jgi:hypothetical protein